VREQTVSIQTKAGHQLYIHTYVLSGLSPVRSRAVERLASAAMYHPMETPLQQYFPAAECYRQAEVYQQVAPQPQFPPNYDFAYCEAQWMYYNSQPCGQYEAYYYREAFACSYLQV